MTPAGAVFQVVRRLKARQGARKIAANTGWLLFDRVLRLGVGLFVGVWMARYLGPDRFGIWSYATAFVLLFSSFAALGLDNIVVREAVREPERRDEILGSAFILKLAGGLLAFALSVVAISLTRPADHLMRIAVAVTATTLIFQSFDAVDFYFQSQVRSKYTVLARGSAFLVVSLAKVALILAAAPLMAFIWVGAAEVALAAGGLAFAYRLAGRSIRRWKPRLPMAGRLLRDSWPLVLTGLVIAVYMRIDQIMLGNMIGDAAVGKYSAAVRLSEVWYVIPTAVTASVFPSVINARRAGGARYLDRLQRLYDLMVWLGAAVAAPMTFLAAPLVGLLYGSGYHGAGAILAVHIWTGPFVFFAVASSQYLMVENFTRLYFYRTAFGAVLNIGLNLVLIPKYQGVGAACATLVSQFFVACVSPAFFRESRIISVMFLKSLNPVRAARNLAGAFQQ